MGRALRSTRIPWLVGGALAAFVVASCGTVTGLDDYSVVACEGCDAGADIGSDGRGVVREPDASDEQKPAIDGAAPDGAARDASPTGADAGEAGTPLPCPASCNGGCPGGVCTIVCAGCAGPVVCPPGRACAVSCSGNCPNVVDCSAGTDCTIRCTGAHSCENAAVKCGTGRCTVFCTGNNVCNTTKITAATASSFCLACDGTDACSDTACQNPPLACTKACSANGDPCFELGATCSGCTSVETCPQ